MCVCVCVCVCMHTCMHACMCTCMCACMCVWRRVYVLYSRPSCLTFSTPSCFRSDMRSLHTQLGHTAGVVQFPVPSCWTFSTSSGLQDFHRSLAVILCCTVFRTFMLDILNFIGSTGLRQTASCHSVLHCFQDRCVGHSQLHRASGSPPTAAEGIGLLGHLEHRGDRPQEGPQENVQPVAGQVF